jgi:hypothetical protein
MDMHEVHQPEGGQKTGGRTMAPCDLYNIGQIDVQKCLLALELQPMGSLSKKEVGQHQRSLNVLRWWLAWCQTVPFSTQRMVSIPLPRWLSPCRSSLA